MLKAGDLARREDHRVRGVKSGRTQADRGISHRDFPAFQNLGPGALDFGKK